MRSRPTSSSPQSMKSSDCEASRRKNAAAMSDDRQAAKAPVEVDIRLSSEITISTGAAAYIADLIDLARQLLALRNGCALGEHADSIERRLRECIHLRATYDNVRTEVPPRQHVLPSHSDLTVKTAAAELGITEAGVRWACRNRQLGRKIGSQWRINPEELAMYKSKSTYEGLT